LIWKLWGAKAKKTAISLSHAKYATAKWLNSIAAAHEFFKSSRHFKYAANQTEYYIKDYVDNHRTHFKYTFAQTLMFLLLYAGASAALLGLGGWLVIQGQLSIGQLIAAELIMSAVFFGLSRFSIYLKLYYELFGAADKIGSALNIQQEVLQVTDDNNVEIPHTLDCHNLLLSHYGNEVLLDVSLPQSTKLFVHTEHNWRQRKLVNLIKSYEHPPKGWIKIGGVDIADFDTYELRQMVAMVDRSLIVDCTIKEYLRMSDPQAPLSIIRGLIEQVGLEHIVSQLPDGLDTKMSPMGAPLQPMEILLLKLAAALLSKPKVLILNQHFDAVPELTREKLLQMLAKQNCVILYFSNHPHQCHFDGVLNLDAIDDVTQVCRPSLTLFNEVL
jgi:putative ABC transport system ATP-binding protein